MVATANWQNANGKLSARLTSSKRLYRLLLSYPLNAPNAPTLGVTSLREPNFNHVARNPKSSEGEAGLVQICRLCVAVGAMGPANERVIAKIQALDEAAMVELMKTIEGVSGIFWDCSELRPKTGPDVSYIHSNAPRSWPPSPRVRRRTTRRRLIFREWRNMAKLTADHRLRLSVMSAIGCCRRTTTCARVTSR